MEVIPGENSPTGALSAPVDIAANYRTYLEQAFQAKKRINPRFSMRRFAEIVGFKSPNYLQLIIDGSRSLSFEMAQQISDRLRLSPTQREYFLALVQVDVAKSVSEKHDAERARLVALKKIVSREIPTAQQAVLSRWYHMLVRELFLLPKAKTDPKWIAAMLNHCITEEEAEGSLEVLCRSGFLVPDGNSFRVAEPVLRTTDSFQAVFMRQHHSELLKTWSKNLDTIGPKQQELGVLNIPIHSSKIPELKRRIQLFQDEIVGLVQSENEADCVVQLGTYLMPFVTVDEV